MRTPKQILIGTVLAMSGFIQAAPLSGVVLDQNGAARAGVVVKLVRAGLSTTTDANGKWTLVAQTTGVSKAGFGSSALWTGKSLEFNLLQSAPVEIEMLDAQGARMGSIQRMTLSAGEQRIEMNAASLYPAFVRLRVGSTTTTFSTLSKGRTNLSSSTLSGAARLSADTPDTLTFEWKGVRFLSKAYVAELADYSFHIDFTLRADIKYDTLYDYRDGRRYPTVKIGKQVWMAQNLDYTKGLTKGTWCQDTLPNNRCAARLYDWATLTGFSSDTMYTRNGMGWDKPFAIQQRRVQGLCPDGWHIPARTAWDTLSQIAAQSYASAPSRALMALEGWTGLDGKDMFGFRALPNGSRDTTGKLWSPSGVGSWWTSTDSMNTARIITLTQNQTIDLRTSFKQSAYPVRCVADKPAE